MNFNNKIVKNIKSKRFIYRTELNLNEGVENIHCNIFLNVVIILIE